jgi:hypothetical protein
MRVVLSNRDNFRPSSLMIQALMDLNSELVDSLSADGYQGTKLTDAEAQNLANKRGLVFKNGYFFLVNDARSIKTRSHPDFVKVAESLGANACFFHSSFDILELEEGADSLVSIETRQGFEHLAPLGPLSLAQVA